MAAAGNFYRHDYEDVLPRRVWKTLLEDLPPLHTLIERELADGSSGLDAVNEILRYFKVPVIFVTSYPERLLTGERPEPTFLMTKPIKVPELQAMVGQALSFGNR